MYGDLFFFMLCFRFGRYVPVFFFFNDTATTEIYTLSLHDALPISLAPYGGHEGFSTSGPLTRTVADAAALLDVMAGYETGDAWWAPPPDRPFAAEAGADPGRLRVAVTTTPPLDAEVAP